MHFTQVARMYRVGPSRERRPFEPRDQPGETSRADKKFRAFCVFCG
jgi:hypothetical protein